MTVSFIGGGNLGTRRKPALSHNIASGTPQLCEIPTHNVSGDRH